MTTPAASPMMDAKRWPVCDRKATLSEDGLYRYDLRRTWDSRRLPVAFLGLNPSTADATVDDPTIRRCVGFARAWDAGGIRMVNLYALRSTEPIALHGAEDPIGPDNDGAIQLAMIGSRFTVACWGAFRGPSILGRIEHVLGYFQRAQARPAAPGYSRLMHLGLTTGGAPRHPLYLRKDTEPRPWTPWARVTPDE